MQYSSLLTIISRVEKRVRNVEIVLEGLVMAVICGIHDTQSCVLLLVFSVEVSYQAGNGRLILVYEKKEEDQELHLL